MIDLTDEDIARCEQMSDFRDEEFWALLAEVKRHRATMRRLEEWATQLDDRDWEAMGKTNHNWAFAAELRNRIKGG